MVNYLNPPGPGSFFPLSAKKTPEETNSQHSLADSKPRLCSFVVVVVFLYDILARRGGGNPGFDLFWCEPGSCSLLFACFCMPADSGRAVSVPPPSHHPSASCLYYGP